MFYHILDDGILHVGWIGNGDALLALGGLQADGGIVEHREAYLTLGADNLDTVFAGTLVGHVAPRSTARQAVFELETCTHRVLSLVQSATIAAYTTSLEDYSKQVLQYVELMRGHVVEVTASGYIGLQSPGQWLVIGDSIEVGLSRSIGRR